MTGFLSGEGMRRRAWFVAISLVAVAIFCAGCGTPRGGSDDVSALLRGLEEREAARNRLGGPEQPVSGLPPYALTPDAIEAEVALTIQPDCLLQVRVAEDSSLNGSYPVNKIGAIQLGYVGPVILYNKSETAAAAKIVEVLKAREFRNATVRVKILRASYDRVEVVGAVDRPGVIQIGAGDTISLNDALLRAGGLKASIRGAKVRIVRDGLLSAVAPALKGEEYSLVSEEGDPNVPRVLLKNNDVAFVYSIKAQARQEGGGKTILVLGEVKRKGLYHFNSTEPATIMHLIFKMGGLPQYANVKAIRIIRTSQDGFEEEIKINAKRILSTGDPTEDFQLENGDRVIVPGRPIGLF